MRSSSWMFAALASLFVPALVLADPAPVASTAPTEFATTSYTAVEAAPTLSLTTPMVAGVRYRPRGYYRGERSNYFMPTWTQIHAGFLDPTDNFGTSFDGGVRIGPMVDPHVQLGVGVDWWHRNTSQTANVGSIPIPGGGGANAQIELSHSTADLLPVLGFVQVSGDEDMPVVPYAGAGAGYEWLIVSADLPDGSTFDQTFSAFGWQGWVGAGIPFSNSRARINGEIFYNGSEPAADVILADGTAAHVKVNMNGVGMRFGVSWGF